MPYHLERDEPYDTGLRRILLERIDKAVRHIDGESPHEAVHNVRKRCKQVRAVLRLLRPAEPELYQNGNALFRDLARRLSGPRDKEALLECHDQLMTHFEGEVDRNDFAHFRRELTLRREAKSQGLDLRELLREAHRKLLETRAHICGVPLTNVTPESVIAGLAKTYGRGAEAMAEAKESPSAEALHEWRKRAKYNRYQFRLLRPLWPELLKPLRNAAKELSDVLGDHHDLAVLCATLRDDPRGFADDTQRDAYLDLIGRRSAALELRAWEIGAQLYAMEKGALRRWLESLAGCHAVEPTGPVIRNGVPADGTVVLM